MEYARTAKPDEPIYSVSNGQIKFFHFIAVNERRKGLYAYSGSDNAVARLISFYSVGAAYYCTTPEEAHEALYAQAVADVETIDSVYFDGAKGTTASVIHAAPAMLEALENIVGYENRGRAKGEPRISDHWYDIAVAAIAQAKG